MTGLHLVPVILSLLVLAAHFLRGGNLLLVALPLALVAALAVRRRWIPWVVQGVLLLGAAEWARTLMALASARREAGLPGTRMALILGGVALFTALSAAAFRTARVKRWYGGS